MEMKAKSRIIKVVKKKEPLAETTVAPKSVDIENIFKFYKIDADQDKDVTHFLTANSDSIPFLIEAEPQLVHIFGKAPVSLQLETDPDEGFKELFGMVKISPPVKKARALVERFDTEWFSPVFKETRGRLNFDVEFIEWLRNQSEAELSSIGRELSHLRNERNHADYDSKSVFGRIRAENSLLMARSIVHNAEKAKII